MASYNRILLMGNLTRDPDHKQLNSGQAVCRLSIATNRQFKNRQTGTMVQEVCYIDVDVWGPQADNCRQYLQKGRSVLVEGRLKLDSWQDQTGVQRTKHSVVADRVLFLGQGAGAQDNSLDVGMHDEMQQESAPQSLRGGDLVLNPHNKVEKDLMDQLERAEKKVKAARSVKERTVGNGEDALANMFGPSTEGELDFKDQPPFEDELPF